MHVPALGALALDGSVSGLEGDTGGASSGGGAPPHRERGILAKAGGQFGDHGWNDGDRDVRRKEGVPLGRRKGATGTADEWLWSLEEMRWRRTFPGTLDQVPVARRFARSLFSGSPCADVVEYAVAELAGNALRHSGSAEHGGWFGVELVHDDPVHVAVTDVGGGGVPTVRDCVDEFEESGRGLYLLSRFAISLGIHGSPGAGHTVWVDLDLDRSLDAVSESRLPVAP